MVGVIMIISLIGACLSIAFGVVRIGSWLIARRDYVAGRRVRDAALIAQARAEVRNG